MEEIASIIENSQATLAPVKDISSIIDEVDPHPNHKLLGEHLYNASATCDLISNELFGSSTSQSIVGVAAFSLLSILFTSSVAIMMQRNKQLMAHPNRLIYYMCLCEGIIAWQALVVHIGPKSFICYFNLADLFQYTWFWASDEASTIMLLTESNYKVLQFFEFVSLALNLFLCLDIVLTMRNPFYPHERRMKFYLGFSLLIAIVCFPLALQRVSEPAEEEKLDKHERALFSVAFLTLYIIFAITSVAYAWRVNTRPGMSTEVRKKFINRHTLYVVTYILTWLPYLGFAYYILYISTVAGSELSYEVMLKDERFYSSLNTWFNIYNLSCIGTGILMSIVRMREPVFKSVIYRFLYQFFGEIYEDGSKNKSSMDSTLLSFLMSSLNIELVHIILTTVSQNTVGTPKSLKDYKVYQNYDHSNKNTFVLDSIAIEDRKSWDVQTVQQQPEENQAIKRSQITMGTQKTRQMTLMKQAETIVENKLVINEDIEVTEYAPDVFAFLRQKDGYDNDILRKSLDPEANKKMVFKAGESQGKSGSFFFFSADQRFIIKTMTDSDFDAFQRIQKPYFAHVIRHDNSLLARVYGIYSIQMEDQKPVKLIVMENGMRGASDIQAVFDLKGSMINRIVKGRHHKPTATLKDQNLLKMNQEKIWLRFSLKDRKSIMSVMQHDIKLLETYNLMDYSLLTCIQENPDFVKVMNEARMSKSMMSSKMNTSVGSNSEELTEIRRRFEGSRHKFLSKCGRYIYHIGIIDYLQDFNFDKKLENLFKQRIMMAGAGISAVPPPNYGLRFLRFMRDHVIIDQKEGLAKSRNVMKNVLGFTQKLKRRSQKSK